jgi:hypothetical protein
MLFPSSLVDLFADAISIQLMGSTWIVVDIIYDPRSCIPFFRNRAVARISLSRRRSLDTTIGVPVIPRLPRPQAPKTTNKQERR